MLADQANVIPSIYLISLWLLGITKYTFLAMKESLREPLISARKQLSNSDVQNKSKNIVEIVKNSNVFENSKNIAIYHAVNGEADPGELQNRTMHKTFFLPVLSKQENQGLLFAPVNQNNKFEKNRFSIPEPVCAEDDLVAAQKLDLVIVPLLGFDRKGNRLGMGGGFYDRSLAFRIQQKTKPLLLGFAYDFQEIDPIESEPWDVKMDMVATESELIQINN